MNETLTRPVPRSVHQARVDIEAIATAVPSFQVTQDTAREQARAYFKRLGYMEAIFQNSGIGTRYSCVPIPWFLRDHGWRERSELFHKHALELLEQAATRALDSAQKSARDVRAMVTVTSTGVAIPSLDATLANRLGLPGGVERMPLFGLGCAGGASGLARATRMARSFEDGIVLLLVVELCSINFRLRDLSRTNFVTTALFGDGAVAMVLRRNEATGGQGVATRVAAYGEHLWPDSENLMGFTVEDDGLGVVLSPEVPAFVLSKLPDVVDAFLSSNGVSLGDLDGFLFHPGGGKVLSSIQEALGLDESDLSYSRDVLEEFGNMSAPTVLFVLERALREGARGLHLLGAFGPGFSGNLLLLELGA
jgi:alkylresorcinol/alkylpyrone synthase